MCPATEFVSSWVILISKVTKPRGGRPRNLGSNPAGPEIFSSSQLLMLFRAIMAVCCGNHSKSLN
jgi:hypothetical protein